MRKLDYILLCLYRASNSQTPSVTQNEGSRKTIRDFLGEGYSSLLEMGV